MRCNACNDYDLFSCACITPLPRKNPTITDPMPLPNRPPRASEHSEIQTMALLSSLIYKTQNAETKLLELCCFDTQKYKNRILLQKVIFYNACGSLMDRSIRIQIEIASKNDTTSIGTAIGIYCHTIRCDLTKAVSICGLLTVSTSTPASVINTSCSNWALLKL